MISQRTQIWDIHMAGDISVDNLVIHPQIKAAARLIRQGEVVAFPTETVYGLGGNAFSDEAVRKIFAAKGRPADNPLIVHIAAVDMLADVAESLSEQAEMLIERFWPGPLTLVLPRGDKVCDSVTGGLDSVAVRMPAHPVALALIKASGCPIAAPSANRSGKPSPTEAEHVRRDLEGRIAGILDAGSADVGMESTVLDLTAPTPLLLRPGGITKEELEDVLGPVEVEPSLEQGVGQQDKGDLWTPRSPGLKYTHYAPDGELYLVSLTKGIEAMRRLIQEQVNQDKAQGERVAVLTTDEGRTFYDADLIISLGDRSDLAGVARRLYGALRQADQAEMTKIYSETFPENQLGQAIMNRLLRAAGGRLLLPEE